MRSLPVSQSIVMPIDSASRRSFFSALRLREASVARKSSKLEKALVEEVELLVGAAQKAGALERRHVGRLRRRSHAPRTRRPPVRDLLQALRERGARSRRIARCG